METINLGKVAFAYKGDYNPATTYASKDVVFDGESSYISKSDGNVGNALSNTAFWGYLAKGSVSLSEQNAEDIDTLRADLNKVETNLNVGIKNLITNGDFSSGLTGWFTGASTNSVLDGVMMNTGNGTNIEASLTTFLSENKIVGDKYYGIANVKVKSTKCIRLRLYSVDTLQTIGNPIMDTQYIMSGIISASTSSTLFGIYHRYNSKADANGSTIEVDNSIFINLTKSFGSGNEPTKEQMDRLIELSGYFDGTLIDRNALMRWLIENQKAINGVKANHGYGLAQQKTVKQVEDEVFSIESRLGFGATKDLVNGVEKTIPYFDFDPILSMKPVSIHVFKNGEQMSISKAKYITNGDNFDIKITSTADLSEADISVVGSNKKSTGDILVWNANTQLKEFISPSNYVKKTGVTPLGVVFHIEGGKKYIVSIDDVAKVVNWASPFKAKLTGFDLTTGGSFTISVNSVTTLAINYTSNETLTTIANTIRTIINAGANDTELKNWIVAEDIVNNCIILIRNYYKPGITTFSVSDITLKVVGEILCQDYQARASGLITTYNLLERIDGTLYGEAGLNFERFYSYLYNNGATTKNQAVNALTIIRYSVYNETDNPLLVAYYGPGENGYGKYIWGKMIKYPFSSIALMNGKSNTDLLNITYTDVDGTAQAVFPAAYHAKKFGVSIVGQTTGLEAGSWWLPSVYEMYFLIHGRRTDGLDMVNKGLAKIGGTLLDNANIGYWTSNEASNSQAVQDYGSSGRFSLLGKYVSQNGSIPMHVRAITVI